MAHKLNKKMLNPTSIEKSNVGLANSCFHESTINALRYYSTRGYSSFADTATFLQIIRDWFNVVNVKSLFSGQKNRDERRDPVTFGNRHQLDFLQDFYHWLERWSDMNGRGLSEQTFHHAKVTTLNLIHVANYLLDEKHLDYVLFGKIQSDPLEGRFQNYRQLCGANYFNSVAQFVQAEKKIRLKSLVKMGFFMKDIQNIFSRCNDATSNITKKSENELMGLIGNFDFSTNFNISVTDEATMFYTTGAIVRGFLKTTNCKSCVTMLSCNYEPLQIRLANDEAPPREEFLDLCNRGGLIKPSDLVQVACLHSWSLYSYIMEQQELSRKLMASPNPRSVFVNVFLKQIEMSNCTEELITERCRLGCQFKDKLEQIAVATFNLKARNYVSDANDQIRDDKGTKRCGNHKKSSDSKKVKKLSST